jgi:hypothetical protein
LWVKVSTGGGLPLANLLEYTGYDLNILHGYLWGEKFHPHAFERKQITGWGVKGLFGRKESISCWICTAYYPGDTCRIIAGIVALSLGQIQEAPGHRFRKFKPPVEYADNLTRP